MNLDTRSRLELALSEAEERVNAARGAIESCLARGHAWAHPNMLGHRARLEKATAERAMLELLLGRGGAR